MEILAIAVCYLTENQCSLMTNYSRQPILYRTLAECEADKNIQFPPNRISPNARITCVRKTVAAWEPVK